MSAHLAFLRKAATLGLGEGISRLAAFSLMVFVGRRLGVDAMGNYVAALTVAQYALLGTDFGFKTIGARLVAQAPDHRGEIVHAVQRQRLRLTLVLLPVCAAYALLGPMPADARLVALVLVTSALPQALSVDWTLWGLERFGWLASWRAGVALLTLALAAAFVLAWGPQLMQVAAAQWVAAAVGAVALLRWTARHRAGSTPAPAPIRALIDVETAWQRAKWTGLAMVLNQLFHTGDTLLLAALSTPAQVGLYNASYKFVFMVIGIYHLFTHAALPALARRGSSQAMHLVLRWSAIAFGVGALVAAAGLATAEMVITRLYGPEFVDAAPLLRIVALAIPFEFAIALMGSALMAWGASRVVTLTTGAATVANLALNAWLIPSYGARAAAWNTVACYVLFLALLVALFVRSARRGTAPA